MLNFQQIQGAFPPYLVSLKKHMFREYLQYKVLDIIFRSKYANKLSFLGGTSLRIVHDNQRFSEDLDFDNFDLTEVEFIEISQIVKRELELDGCVVEIKNIFKGAFRCSLRLPEILFQNELTQHVNEKLLIQLDTFGHNFKYSPQHFELKGFDVLSYINVTPKNILLSQKFFAAFDRKRLKGRDFYDIVFLLSLGVKPDYEYLKAKIAVGNVNELKSYVLEKSKNLDFHLLADDVQPFLFNESDKKKVELFLQYIEAYIK